MGVGTKSRVEIQKPARDSCTLVHEPGQTDKEVVKRRLRSQEKRVLSFLMVRRLLLSAHKTACVHAHPIRANTTSTKTQTGSFDQK